MITAEYLTFSFGTVPVDFTRRKGCKRITLRLKTPARLAVSFPYRMGLDTARQIVFSKQDWLAKHKDFFVQKPGIPYLFGIQYRFVVQPPANQGNDLIIPDYENHLFSFPEGTSPEVMMKLFMKLLVQLASDYCTTEAKKIETETGLTASLIKFRIMKSRWGSCNSKKIITINPLILQFSPEVIRYLIIHEYCHLKYLNHSQQYWVLVRSFCPEYKKLNKELKKGMLY